MIASALSFFAVFHSPKNKPARKPPKVLRSEGFSLFLATKYMTKVLVNESC